MIINEGINQCRDLIAADLDKGQCGDSDTLPTSADTGLGSAIVSTLLTLSSVTTTDKMITTTHSVSSAVANGESLKEHEVRFTDGESFNHVVHATISKDSTKEVDYITSFIIETA